ncbi:hypothetical protein AAEO56_16660 [Flavobacterium sp. DGU11]|uniref:Uncharacterized protein n=1 Tax=Flavobacterium arundinis TaxID=3139143 RepID=A0ABU9I0F6_9FLAO
MAYRALVYFICILAGLVIAFASLMLSDMIMITDECYYHTHKPNFMISILYDFPSWNGSHPVPGIFFMALMAIWGTALGWYVAGIKIRKTYK